MDSIRKLTLEALAEWFGEKDPETGTTPRRSLLLKGGGQTLEPHFHGKEGPTHPPIKLVHHHLNKAWMSHRHAAVANAQADKHLKKIKKGLSKEARAKIHDHVQNLRSKSEKWHNIALHRSRYAMRSYAHMNPGEKEEFEKNVDHDKWKKVVKMAKHDPDKQPVPHHAGMANAQKISQDHQAYWHGSSGPRKAVSKIKDREAKPEPEKKDVA